MSIKVVVLDVSNTTIGATGRIHPGIKGLIEFCKLRNLKVAFASNNPAFDIYLQTSGIHYDCFATRSEVKADKPSPVYLKYIEDKLKISKDTFIYIGDTERDAFLAAHARVLYFHAGWVNHDSRYGIQIDKPQELQQFIDKYLLKDAYFEWSVQNYDLNGNMLQAMALITGTSKFKGIAVDTLKWGGLRHKPFVMNHLISSLYLSGIVRDVDFLATYPSHNVGHSKNAIMEKDLDILSKELRNKYVDLFVRHRESMDSGQSRNAGVAVSFENQLGTIHLNSEFEGRLEKKKILVLDDFITKGYSHECARNLLYKAGVKDVICVGFGKYGPKYNQITIRGQFNPFQRINPTKITIEETILNGTFNVDTSIELDASYNI